ncbi:MAG: SDR family oxidoreductase [Gaiellales bacterium]
MNRLAGKIALITGGASGIGRATARLFLEEGARVTIADNNDALLAATAQELGAPGSLHAVAGDVSKVADGERIVAEAAAAHGGLDIVVCAAGITSRSPITTLLEEEFDRVIAVNLKGMYTIVHAAIPRLKAQGGGTIVTVGSEMGFVADPNAPAYNASKGGVVMFTKSIAIDLIGENIRVNCACPGITQTPLLDAEVATSADPEATRAEFAEWAPIGRAADPVEQAHGILFLASEESSFAVGTTLLLDGGYTAK